MKRKKKEKIAETSYLSRIFLSASRARESSNVSFQASRNERRVLRSRARTSFLAVVTLALATHKDIPLRKITVLIWQKLRAFKDAWKRAPQGDRLRPAYIKPAAVYMAILEERSRDSPSEKSRTKVHTLHRNSTESEPRDLRGLTQGFTGLTQDRQIT